MRSSFRSVVLPGVLALLLAPAVQATPQVDGRRVSVDAADAQQFLDRRFPVSRPVLGDLLEVTASAPRLAIPAGTRLRLSLDLAMATAGGAPVPMGNLLLSSALRYDAAQRAFFLEQPRIESFRDPDGGEGLDAGSRELLGSWLSDYARQQPVYRIDAGIAALLGGLQVESAGIEDGRLVVTFDREVGLAP